MPRLRKALAGAGFDGIAIPDHVPRYAHTRDDKSAEAFIFGKIRGLTQAVEVS